MLQRKKTHFLEKSELLSVEQNPNSYFENTRLRQLDKRQFVFDSIRVNNSPYVLVKGKCHLELVREGDVNELGFRHNGSLSI